MGDFEAIVDIIKSARNKINDDTVVLWTGYKNSADLQLEIDKELDALEKGDIKILDNFKNRFKHIPTSTFQEVALYNGWGNEFIVMAKDFDELYQKIRFN